MSTGESLRYPALSALLLPVFLLFAPGIALPSDAGDIRAGALSEAGGERTSPLRILKIDSSFFPKIEVILSPSTVSSPAAGKLRPKVFEDGRPIRGVVLDRAETGHLRLRYLSPVYGRGPRQVLVSLNGHLARCSYLASRWHRFGSKLRRCLKIRATGPGWRPVPCRLLAFHESGRVFEDLTTPGGYGRLATGFVAPPGSYRAELRLVGLDLFLDEFRFEVKSDRPTQIDRRFAFLRLPDTSVLSGRSPDLVVLEVERMPSRSPRLRSVLSVLQAALPPGLPRGVLPLPPGKYLVRLDDLSNGKDDVSIDTEIELGPGSLAPFPAGRICE